MLGKRELSLGSPSTWGSRGAGQREPFPTGTGSNALGEIFFSAAGAGRVNPLP